MSGSDLAFAFLGGGVGSLARWAVGRLVGRRHAGDCPRATMLTNVTGCLLIGFLTILFRFDPKDRFGHPVNTLVLTGVLGGYTTFSSLQPDTSRLLRRRGPAAAAGYQLGSVALGLLAAGVGAALADLF